MIIDVRYMTDHCLDSFKDFCNFKFNLPEFGSIKQNLKGVRGLPLNSGFRMLEIANFLCYF